MSGMVATVRGFFGWKRPDRLTRVDLLFLADRCGGYHDLLSECARLRECARRAGVELDDTPSSLAALDRLLPVWQAHPEVAAWLPIEAGSYLGTVIIRTVPGTRWRTRSDGRPVVQLPSGERVDVLDATGAGASPPSRLSAVYQRVTAC